jgi:hypothetical protein
MAPLKPILKRGALVTAANWQVVAVQFVAESIFKLLLAVPIVGGLFLVALAIGADMAEFALSTFAREPREMVALAAGALAEHPTALAAFAAALGVVAFGGSAMMFVIKAGTVTTLVTGDRTAGPIEHPPLRLAAMRRACAFGIEPFTAACAALWRPYVSIGLILLALYAMSGAAYLVFVYGGYRFEGLRDLPIGWTAMAALASGALIAWITIMNLLYLLVQMAIAVTGAGVRAGVREVTRFITSSTSEVAAVFAIVLGLVLVATVASIVTAAGLGLIAFVPFVGLAAVPLQVAAWLMRGFVFQYLGLTALAAYISLFRTYLRRSGRSDDAFDAGRKASLVRTA